MSEFKGQTCGIYPRVSTIHQAKEDKTSLKDQEQACRDYADEMEMLVDEDCVEPEAYTSTVMERPALNTLLAKMKAHKVPNLLIDTADRMTREGQIVAAIFLKQFIDAGITLHVVSSELVVDDDDAVDDFLEDALRAKKDNKQRARKAKRAKITRATNGIFIRGSTPPYGYRYVPVKRDDEGNVTERRLEPDERTYLSLGWPTTFAATPYQARCEILRLYREGWSFERISNRLTDKLVPTAWALYRHTETRGVWYPRTVDRIIRHPINHGVLVNHFHHKGQPDQVIEVPSHQYAILDSNGLATISRRLEANRLGHYPHTSMHSGKTLLGGGLGRCGRCGATLRAKGDRYQAKKGERHYLYYVCTRHDKTPSQCPGMTVSPTEVDKAAWEYVKAELNTISWDPDVPGSELRVLERLDAARSAAPRSAGPSLEHLKAVRDDFVRKAETYTLEIARAQSQLARDLLQRQIDQLEPEIAAASAKIAELQRQETLQSERARVLVDFLSKYRRYFEYLDLLDTENESDIPIIAALLRALGAVVTVPPDFHYDPVRILDDGSIDLSGGPDLDVGLTLTAGAGFPWTDNEEMVRMLDERRKRRVEWKDARDADTAGFSLQDSFVKISEAARKFSGVRRPRRST